MISLAWKLICVLFGDCALINAEKLKFIKTSRIHQAIVKKRQNALKNDHCWKITQFKVIRIQAWWMFMMWNFFQLFKRNPQVKNGHWQCLSKHFLMFRSLASSYLLRPSSSLIMEVFEPWARIYRSFKSVSDDVSAKISDEHLDAAPPQRSNPTSFPRTSLLALELTPENYVLSKATLSLHSPILDLDYSPLLMPLLLTLTCLSV